VTIRIALIPHDGIAKNVTFDVRASQFEVPVLAEISSLAWKEK
jgi:hypothetical protein